MNLDKKPSHATVPLNTNALEVLSYIHLRKICEEEGVSF
jgi:hypothetical protein